MENQKSYKLRNKNKEFKRHLTIEIWKTRHQNNFKIK